MEAAAVLVGGILLQVVAACHLALAYGAPWGEHAYGGRATKADGKLSVGYRAMSAAAVPTLLVASWTVLAKADLVSTDAGWIDVGLWVVFAYLLVNTLATSPRTARSNAT